MTKIGVCLDTEENHGGVHQYTLAMVRALQSLPPDRYQVEGLCVTQEWCDYCNAQGIAYHRVRNCIRKDGLFGFGLSFLKQIFLRGDILECKENRIDYVLFPSVTPNMLFVKNPICAIHDLMHRYAKGYPEMCSIYQYALRDVLFRQIAKKSAAVLTDSNVGKRQVEESYLHGKSDDRIKVLPFIAPDYIYESDKLELDDNWEKIQKTLPERFFFYPAQFWKHKNHITILKAFERLKESYPDMHLVFVGSEKNASKQINQYISDHRLKERIHVYGYVSEYSMVQLYKRAVALVMASCCGPTNIPQIEAFFLGCPVIVADVYAVREQVGDAALLFEPMNDAMLAELMEKTWRDELLRKSMIVRGYERSKQWGQMQFNEVTRLIIDSVV